MDSEPRFDQALPADQEGDEVFCPTDDDTSSTDDDIHRAAIESVGFPSRSLYSGAPDAYLTGHVLFC